MQLGRSPEFINHLSAMARAEFQAEDQPAFSADNFRKLYTRVEKGFIRVDADELTYPAHVILRYEIERDLMNGNISYKDVPELWDQKCSHTSDYLLKITIKMAACKIFTGLMAPLATSQVIH